MSNQEPVNTFSSRIVVLPEANIDTDQIIPARFLTTTTKAGLGKVAFNDWRYNADGSDKDFILNQIDAQEHQVLVAGNNLGCGSSREHAPWALMDYGFKAVISTEIADIFKSNSLKNGLLPVVVDKATYDKLLANPQQRVTINLESCELSLEDGTVFHFQVEEFARQCLLEGVDAMGWLIKRLPQIEQYEQSNGKAA
ncbi:MULTISPECIES: 3-isopropylmalate dehydratase small subunit [unclassified Asticcacaulis]|uniref:3-isopropylmalate dehydratase small subunit n=1 Tax=unclassified Asticcacaulis TaxID=2628350 RepID=UPI0003C40021|nr:MULTISPECIES: 3-isopropylmalate dehydratase small subunit [unclassified Asticcacaulis]ESQ84915.1 isopropylmalate isomerase [Asticcacaulis sp. AC466]MDV6332328.1 3-isopropylmalate dehydratase small subunit [Asticcacaulis sp. 201]